MLVPAPVLSITMPGFEHALPVEPQKLEVGGGAAGGDNLLTLFGLVRIGLLDDLDLGLRVGLIDGLSTGKEIGFEVETAPRFRFLRTEDTGFIDAAVVGDVSLAKTENIFALGLDPTFVASHHFTIDANRQVYVSMGLGVSFTFHDQDGAHSDAESGFLGAFGSGVDIVEHLRLSLEARLRDEFQRFGLALTWSF